MQSDFLYPEIADRTVIDVWEAAGSIDIRQAAARRAQEILTEHRPCYIEPAIDRDVRAVLPIELPPLA
jgi:trimethylamine--corrinoid protein Co-methyltransferase